jgi:hypothetical protein
VKKRKILFPYRDSKSDSSAVQPVAGPTDRVKLKLSLCLIKHHGMEKYGGIEACVLNLSTSRDEPIGSRPGRFTHKEIYTDIRLIGASE